MWWRPLLWQRTAATTFLAAVAVDDGLAGIRFESLDSSGGCERGHEAFYRGTVGRVGDQVDGVLAVDHRLAVNRDPGLRRVRCGEVLKQLMSSSLTISLVEGKLALADLQVVFLCEFDGPRERTVLSA